MSKHKSVFVVCLLVAVSVLFSGCSREAKGKRALAKADKYYAAGDLGRAEIEYLNVRKYDYNNTNALSRLAVIYFDQGRLFSAARGFDLATNDANNVELIAKRAQFYALSNETNRALKDVEFVLGRVPDHAEAVLLWTELAGTQGVAQVRQYLQQAEQKTGPRAVYAVASGILLGARDVTNAVKELNRAIQLDAKFSPAYLVMSQIQFIMGDTNKAEASLKTGSELAPLRSNRKLRYASYKLATGAVDEGRQLVEEVAQKAPDYLPAWKLLAKIELSRTNLDSCEKMLGRVLGREPWDQEALTMRGQVFVLKNQLDRAATHWEEVARMFTLTDRTNKQTVVIMPESYLQLARVQAQLKDTTKAIGTLNRFLSFRPMESAAVAAVNLLAEIQLRSGDPAAAAKTLSSQKGGRTDLQGRFLLAEAYAVLKDFDAALEVYQDIESQSPRLPQPIYLGGVVLKEQGKLAEARKKFEKALTLAPDGVDVLFQLAELDLAEKKPQAAMARIQPLVQKYPNSALPYLLLSRVYDAQSQFDLAEQSLQKAIEVDPTNQGAHQLLVEIYLRTGKHSQAIDRLEAYLKRDPKAGQAAGAMFQLAMLYEAKKETDKARDLYEKIIVAEPKATLALNNLAYLYAEKYKQLDKAADIAKRAYDSSPTNVFSMDTYGWILYQRGEYPQALRLVQQSAMVLTNAEVQAHLGMVQYAMGNADGAKASLEKALKMEKDFNGKADVEERLAVLKSASVAVLEKVLAKQPSDAIALNKLTAVYAQGKEYTKLAALYADAFKANPKNLTIASRLAEIYAVTLQKKENALEVIRAAKVGATTDPAMALVMGRLALQLGEPKDSILYLEEASRKTANNAEAYFLLGSAQYQLKEKIAAKKALNEAVRLKVSGKMLEDAKKMLDDLK